MIFVSYVYKPATNPHYTRHLHTVCENLQEFKQQTIDNTTTIGEITILSWQEVSDKDAATLLEIKVGV